MPLCGRFTENPNSTRDDRDTRQREWGVGFNIYHAGDDWKTRSNLLQHDFADRHETVLLLEHHLQF